MLSPPMPRQLGNVGRGIVIGWKVTLALNRPMQPTGDRLSSPGAITPRDGSQRVGIRSVLPLFPCMASITNELAKVVSALPVRAGT